MDVEYCTATVARDSLAEGIVYQVGTHAAIKCRVNTKCHLKQALKDG